MTHLLTTTLCCPLNMKSASTSATAQGISPSYLNWAQTRHRSDETEHFIDSVSEEQGAVDWFSCEIISWVPGNREAGLNQQLDSFIIAIRASFCAPRR